MARAMTLGLFVAVFSGCNGSARYVVREPNGGVVAIPYDSEKNRAKAHDLMIAACPKGYLILREEEVVTGQVTTDSTHTDSSSHDLKKLPITLTSDVTTRTVSAHDTKEIRFVYQATP